MRLVLDTNVVVAGLRSPRGASAELLRRVRYGRPIMLASVALFVEYEAVAVRPEHLSAAGLEATDVTAVLDVLAGSAEAVEIHYLWRPWLRDPDDDMVLEVAVNGRADAIVTFNRAHFHAVPETFGIAVIRPYEALGRP